MQTRARRATRLLTPLFFATLFLAPVLLAPAGPASALARAPALPKPAAWVHPSAEHERASGPPRVEVGCSGSSLVVEPRVSGVATSVYLSCADGTYLHREIEEVAPVLVELVHEDGDPVADGRCKYEIYLHPPVDEEAMRIAEEAGDPATIERLSRIEAQHTVIRHGLVLVAGGVAFAPEEQGKDEQEVDR